MSESADQSPAEPSGVPATASSLPENLLILIGPPRSGTTLLTRVLGNHSQVDAVVEPYQSRRQTNYSVTDVRQLACDFGKPLDRERTLLVKETFSRVRNVELTFALARAAALDGVNVAVFLLLRSPIEAFLSQVEAAQSLWKSKPQFSFSEPDMAKFWKAMQGCQRIAYENIFRYTHRVLYYPSFLKEPSVETRRLMAAVGYGMEPQQLDLEANPKNISGGDPKAYGPGREISSDSQTDRQAGIELFKERFEKSPLGQGFIEHHKHLGHVFSQKGRRTDTQILTDLFLRHGSRFWPVDSMSSAITGGTP